jgi:hypothetical protein
MVQNDHQSMIYHPALLDVHARGYHNNYHFINFIVLPFTLEWLRRAERARDKIPSLTIAS